MSGTDTNPNIVYNENVHFVYGNRAFGEMDSDDDDDYELENNAWGKEYLKNKMADAYKYFRNNPGQTAVAAATVATAGLVGYGAAVIPATIGGAFVVGDLTGEGEKKIKSNVGVIDDQTYKLLFWPDDTPEANKTKEENGTTTTSLTSGQTKLDNGYTLHVSGTHANPNIIFNKNVVHTSPDAFTEYYSHTQEGRKAANANDQNDKNIDKNIDKNKEDEAESSGWSGLALAFGDVLTNSAYTSQEEMVLYTRVWFCGFKLFFLLRARPDFPDDMLNAFVVGLFGESINAGTFRALINQNFDLVALHNIVTSRDIETLDTEILKQTEEFFNKNVDMNLMTLMMSHALVTLIAVQEHMNAIKNLQKVDADAKMKLNAWKDKEKEKNVRVRVTTVNGDVVVGERLVEKPLIVRTDDGETIAFQSEIEELEILD